MRLCTQDVASAPPRRSRQRIVAYAAALIAAMALVEAFGSSLSMLFDVFDPRPWSRCTIPLPASIPASVRRQWPWSAALWRPRPAGRTWWVPWSCPQCILLDDVPEWSGASLVIGGARLPRWSLPPRPQPACRARSLHNLTVVKAAPLAGVRNQTKLYARWAERLGPAPLVAALSRPTGRPLSSILYQRASCPLAAQGDRFFHCQLSERRRARVGGVDLVAAAAPDDGAAARVAVLLHEGHVEENANNIYHVLSFGSGAGNVWCVWEAAQDLRRGGAENVQLVADPRVYSAMSRWKRELLALLLPLWSPPAGREDGRLPSARDYTFERIYGFDNLRGHGTEPFKFEVSAPVSILGPLGCHIVLMVITQRSLN